jgi:hypothetical protein
MVTQKAHTAPVVTRKYEVPPGCDPTISHRNLSSAYQHGCRGPACRAHNALRQAEWRLRQPPKVVVEPKRAPRSTARVLKVRPTSSTPHRQGMRFYAQDETVGITEWARLRGFDFATRTYQIGGQ